MGGRLIVSSILIIIGAVFSLYDKLTAILNPDEFVNYILEMLGSTGVDVPEETVKTIVLSVLIFGLVFSVLLLLTGILIYFIEKRRKALGVLSILFAILSLNIISMILGIVGAVLAITYKPQRPSKRMEIPGTPPPSPEEPII